MRCPDSTTTNGPSKLFTPRSLSVAATVTLSSITIADESATTSESDTTNSPAAANDGGGRSDQASSPNSGNNTPASSTMSAARGSAREVIHPAARAYQSPYVSTGRSRSKAIDPESTASAISGSHDHPASAR